MIVTTLDSGVEAYGIPGESWTKWWILEFSERVLVDENTGRIPEEARDHILTHCRAWGHTPRVEAGGSFASEGMIYVDNMNSDKAKQNYRALVMQSGGLDI